MTEEIEPSLFRRVLRLTGRLTLTVGFVGVAAFAVVFGQGVLSDRASAVPSPAAALPTPVTTKIVRYEDSFQTQRSFLGQIEAKSSVDVSFELSGLLTELSVSEGDEVEQGDVIARLDTALLEAEKERLLALKSATEAQLVFAQTRVDRAQDLQKRGFTSVEERDRAIALRNELRNRIAETEASLQSIAINLAKSVVYAPIGGRIAEQQVDQAETVVAGQTVAVVLETSAPQFRVGLPLGIDVGLLSSAEVNIAGQVIPAQLAKVRPDIDPLTRTRIALFDLPKTQGLVFGQTATLVLDVDTESSGFWVSLRALQQGEGRVWSVLTVDADNTVRQAAIEVIHTEHDKSFVKGSLQNGDQLIADGAHRVVPGQKVRPKAQEF